MKTEKVIARPVADVFAALKDGLLLMNCGSDSAATKIDFRVGGHYDPSFKNKTLRNFGEFLEIVPDKRIVFNWCQTFGEDQKPDTTVTIELFPVATDTKIVLQFTVFKTEELEVGRLRFLRTYELPVAKLFEVCKAPPTLPDFKIVEATSPKKNRTFGTPNFELHAERQRHIDHRNSSRWALDRHRAKISATGLGERDSQADSGRFENCLCGYRIGEQSSTKKPLQSRT